MISLSRAAAGFLLASLVPGSTQTLTEIFQPPSVSSGLVLPNRIQTVARYTVSGLKPNASYRYVVGFGKASGDEKGAGGFWAINNTAGTDGYIVGYCGTGAKSLDSSALAGDENANESRYGEFVADANGEYTGWFATVGTGNVSRFTPGRETRFILTINGGDGDTVPTSLIGERGIRALSQEAGVMQNSSTMIIGDTRGTVPPETIVLLYDAVEGGDPVWGTWVESIGIQPPAGGPDSPYAHHVKDGYWAAYVPNDLADGVRRIEYYSPEGALLGKLTSRDGKWKPLAGSAYAKANGDSRHKGGVTEVIGIEAPLAR